MEKVSIVSLLYNIDNVLVIKIYMLEHVIEIVWVYCVVWLLLFADMVGLSKSRFSVAIDSVCLWFLFSS